MTRTVRMRDRKHAESNDRIEATDRHGCRVGTAQNLVI